MSLRLANEATDARGRIRAARRGHAETAHSAPPAVRPAAAARKPVAPSSSRTVLACSGPFAQDPGMLELAMIFGSNNIIFTEEKVDGAAVGATVLYPKDPRRRLEVWWSNPNRTGLYLIDIAGKSVWTGPDGLRLGLTLARWKSSITSPSKPIASEILIGY
jgi:hypothetical protein